MSEFSAPFVVEASFRLPGLGLLVMPAAPEPEWLLAHDLHTALAVAFLFTGQPSPSVIGTIEEVTHDEQPRRRALLLDFDPGTLLAPGTHLQVREAPLELQ